MPTGTKFAPTRISEFDAAKLQFNAQGAKASPSLNTTTNIDLYFADDHLLTGFWVVCTGAAQGDSIALKAVDTDNIMGFGAGVVLKTFASNIYIATNFDAQFDVAYPAKVYAGLSLRVVYTSTTILGSPFFAVNYKLHKVLI